VKNVTHPTSAVIMETVLLRSKDSASAFLASQATIARPAAANFFATVTDCAMQPSQARMPVLVIVIGTAISATCVKRRLSFFFFFLFVSL
jgi:hypothetical protein